MNVTGPSYQANALQRSTHGNVGQGAPRRAGMDAAAALIGVEPRELSSRVRSGEALVDIAAKAGIGSTELKAVMTDAITETAPPGVADRLVAGLDDQIRVRGGVVGPRAQRHPSAGGAADRPPAEQLESLASTLDMKPDQVIVSIQDGSFRRLLADRGVQAGLGILVNLKL